MLYKQLAGSELEQLNVPIGTGLDDILETIRIHWAFLFTPPHMIPLQEREKTFRPNFIHK